MKYLEFLSIWDVIFHSNNRYQLAMVLQYAKGSAFDMWDPDESAVTLERHMMDAKRALLDLRPRTRRKCFQDVK
jgi:hypothetical protein